MKVFPVSFKNNNNISPFMYTAKDNSKNKKSYFFEHRYEYIGGILATVATICAIRMFKGKAK